MSNVAVVGAGAWGTALALQATRAGHHVTLVTRTASLAAHLRGMRRNERLPGVMLPSELVISEHVEGYFDVVLWATPTQYLRQSILALRPAAGGLVICAKGIEAATNLLPLEIAQDISNVLPVAVLSGPNFAHEVAIERPSATVVASTDLQFRETVRRQLASPTFRIYCNDDPLGVGLGGAAKNVIAIAAGAVVGAGLGENARAALITRGISELCRLVLASGGKAETVMGLSGLGDLVLTCTGAASRNFQLGYALGQGKTLPEALTRQAGVTEGVGTAAALVSRAGSIEMPICQAVADLLGASQTVSQVIDSLLARPFKDE